MKDQTRRQSTYLRSKRVQTTGATSWFAPAGTPAANVNALNTAVNGMLDSPAMRDVFERNALEPFGETPAKLTARLKADYDYWARVVKSTGFTPED
ncbi:MAG: hypothetical protein EON54_12795 [Alcaligenaceae bacterium]|nr:MAG: hypothetical protein EON54_12795 [Alcaligenaceae bacterium]